MFLGIDIGTSSVKAVLIGENGHLVETSASELQVSRPHPLWSEQHPEDWWDATTRAVHGLDVKGRQAVEAVGLSGQMHGATLLDASLSALRPAILWNDGRSFAEAEGLQRSEPAFMEKGGNLVMPGFTAPKLEWVRRHEPEIFSRVKKVLLPKDYIRLRMTGELASDMSDSAGTLWMDVANRQWHEPLLAACGLSLDQMPELYEGTDVTGALRQNVAEAWGMARVPVVAGAGDNAAGAVGAGVIDNGDGLLSLGTSGVIFVSASNFRSNPASAVHAFCHALPDRWHLMSVMLSAASCVDWACRVTSTASARDMIALAEENVSFDGREIFLPYLSGERTPHNNPHASGVFFGLDHDSSRSQIAQAVLEGIAFGLADGFDALLETGIEVESLSVIGGGSQSLYWGRILAAALQRPMVYRDGSATGPALGAARLARYAQTGGSLHEAFAPPHVTAVIEPDKSDIEQLSAKRENFRRLYKALSPLFSGDENGRN